MLHHSRGFGYLISSWDLDSMLQAGAQQQNFEAPGNKGIRSRRCQQQDSGAKKTWLIYQNNCTFERINLKEAFEKAKTMISKWTWQKYVPGLRSADPNKLVVSLAESIVARNLARPATIPLKIWLTWQLMLQIKTPETPETNQQLESSE